MGDGSNVRCYELLGLNPTIALKLLSTTTAASASASANYNNINIADASLANPIELSRHYERLYIDQILLLV
jgi:hypothetical protein